MNANYNTTTNDDSHHAHEASQFSSRHSLTTNPSSLFRVAAARRGKVLLISLSLSPIFSSIALNLSLSTFSRHLYLHRQTQTQRRGVIIIIILMMLNPSEGQAAQQITSHRPRHTCRGCALPANSSGRLLYGCRRRRRRSNAQTHSAQNPSSPSMLIRRSARRRFYL